MLFNSIEFIVFFSVVYILYLNFDHKRQNYFLLIASYFFYAWWSWKFCFLMALSTIIDFTAGRHIFLSKTKKAKKFWLSISVISNLSLLGFFKYFNFFLEELEAILSIINLNINNLHLHIVLPVGISFYTFQTISYSLDIYTKKLEPVNTFWDFALFVSFFPQLVAGPIERAKRLLPQILSPRKITINQQIDGLILMAWGLYKKIFVADLLAASVNGIFSTSINDITGYQTILGALFFAFQIYCDFSGYSDIARGTAKMMGFDLMLNFRLPYFSQNPAEFWRRWHISLSSWLRDYLYIPLGGSKHGIVFTFRNLMITMILGGLWHGANSKFVLWGIYQGLLLCCYRGASLTLNKLKFYRTLSEKRIYKILSIIITFVFVCYGWLIFRAESYSQLAAMTKSIVVNSHLRNFPISDVMIFLSGIWLILLVQIVQYLIFEKKYLYPVIVESVIYRQRKIFKFAAVYVFCALIFLSFIVLEKNYFEQQFIYFQF